MKFPHYWAKGSAEARPHGQRPFIVNSWRWSDVSHDDARAAATAAAQHIAQRLTAGELHGLRYPYGVLPLREEVLSHLTGAGGAVSAFITRNAYGCRILNAAGVMFVDIDWPQPASVGGWFRRFKQIALGDGERAPLPEATALERIKNWLSNHAHWGLRVYRTKGGLRLMAIHDLFDPGARSTWTALEALGCDPLYVRLCQTQTSFRARLTPKPWRCAARRPPTRFPFETTAAEQVFRAWQEEYEAQQRRYATCALLGTLGRAEVHPEVRPIAVLHDDETRASSGLPLA